MTIDAEAFYLCCAQAVRIHSVTLVNLQEFNDRYRMETEYLKQKRQIVTIYEPLATLGYQNFIVVDDGAPYEGREIVTLFEVIG